MSQHQIDQLRLKLDIFRKQSRRQTKEIAKLRTENANLRSELMEAYSYAEFKNTRRHLIGTTLCNLHHDKQSLMELGKLESHFPLSAGTPSSEHPSEGSNVSQAKTTQTNMKTGLSKHDNAVPEGTGHWMKRASAIFCLTAT